MILIKSNTVVSCHIETKIEFNSSPKTNTVQEINAVTTADIHNKHCDTFPTQTNK